ncbi:MAG TPA: amidohydrolase family protein, partial [Chloroflexia bacterium]|nr:amidohydrolase family protein [Chloroflexia bacterium]
MPTLLVKHANPLVAMNDADEQWPDGGLYAVDGVVRQIGPTSELPETADLVLNARGMLIMPGLVNTHHHFFQTLTRNIPTAQDANLFKWLVTHYPIWAHLTPEAIYVSSKIAIAELLLS